MVPGRMGFHVEDMYLITAGGFEKLTGGLLPHDELIEVGGELNMKYKQAGSVTSPRLRGEVGVRAKRGLRVRGRLYMAEPVRKTVSRALNHCSRVVSRAPPHPESARLHARIPTSPRAGERKSVRDRSGRVTGADAS